MKTINRSIDMGRWMVLWVAVANVVFHFSSSFLFRSPLEHNYTSLVSPASYAFVIWLFIYTGFLLYAVYQLLPQQQSEPLYDRLVIPFVLVNVFSILRIICYRMDLLGASEIVTVAMLITAIGLYVRSRNAVLRGDINSWISLPFSVYAAWLSVASIANTSVWLLSMGVGVNEFTQVITAIIVLLTVAALGIYVGFRCGDYIFPGVISWYCIAVVVAVRPVYGSLAVVALIGAAMPLVWSVTTGLNHVYYRHKVWSNKYHLG